VLPIPGTHDLQHLEDNVAAARLAIGKGELAAL
jgi:aryl-alcohol dehydrogenase-like predicted oxidoreductase